MSIYTCYQDKDEVGEVAEYCTPLLANERKDFDLPLSLFMPQSSFPTKAREYAKRARYIEFLETFPEEVPEFQKKTRGSTATLSVPRFNDYYLNDNELLRAVSGYENALIDLIKTRIKGDMKDLSSKEKLLELSKEKVKEAKEKAAQTRLQYQNNQQ